MPFRAQFRLEKIRNFLGWKNEITLPAKSSVAVFSHTSYLDIIPALLYLDYFSQGQFQCMLVVKDAWYMKLLELVIDVIYAPSIHNRGGNGVDYIFDQVSEKRDQQKKLLIPLSPKGTIKKSNWRTGYYYLAKKLNCDVIVFTPDFSKRCVFTSPPLSPNDYSCQEMERCLKEYFAKTGSINIQNLEYTQSTFCCPYESCLPFDFCVVSLLCFLPYVVLTFTRTSNYLLQFFSTYCFYYSLVYHMNYEYSSIDDVTLYKSLKRKETYLVYTTILLQLYESQTKSDLHVHAFMVALICGVFFYLNSIPREHKQSRGKYALFHGFFHVCASIVMMLLIS